MPFKVHWIQPDGSRIIVPNFTVEEGAATFLKLMFQNDGTDFAAGFFVGLCDQVPGVNDTLASISTEPTAAGGYARQAVARSAVGFPTVSAVNDVAFARSLVVTFAASGANFSRAFTRCFLCNVASGTAGKLFAYSGPLNEALLLLDGQSRSIQFEYFLR